MPTSLSGAAPFGGMEGGRRGVSVKTLKRMLKKAGLKTTGRKAALTLRAKKAHLKMRGGEKCTAPGVPEGCDPNEMGGRRRRRGSRRQRGGECVDGIDNVTGVDC